MIVELLGVPGSGKSTLSKELCKKYKASNPLELHLYDTSRIKQNLNKVRITIAFYIKDFSLFHRLLCLFRKLKFQNIKDRMKMFLYLFSVIGIINSNISTGDIVVDEGVGQVIWGLLYYSTPDSHKIVFEILELLRAFIGDWIYVMPFDRDVILERLNARTSGGGASLNREVKFKPRALDISNQYINIIVDYYIKNGFINRIKEVR